MTNSAFRAMEKASIEMWTKYFLLLIGLATFATGQMRRPNVILFVTDDQDVMLNSMNDMIHTRECITERGIQFSNAFTTTPMCCPSRSSILTGLYAHNHQVYTNNDNCSSLLWQRFHESKSYATYLKGSGYRTGYFGKYLNEYNGSYTPPGWDYWMGLVKNSKYYNYTLIHNGHREIHGDNYAEDYLTDLVTNRSIDYFRASKREDPERPVLSVVSFPAPHGPEDSAPQYRDLYYDTTTHMTRSFNYIPNPDKHWIVKQNSELMDEDQLRFSRLLQQKRLQTLRSVDDNVKKIIDMLQDMRELENTYILYSSDHGYHIGQFGLPKGKSMPYDFDIRIPFLIRGPGIPQNETSKKIALNIDIAPTILGIAGVPIPDEMDGRNLLDLFDLKRLDSRPWRDSFLVERGKMPRNKTQLVRPRMLKETKIEKLKKLCESRNYVYPCQPQQYWTCSKEAGDKWRLQKCKKEKPPKAKARTRHGNGKRKLCPCPESKSPWNGVDGDSDEVNALQMCSGRLPSSGYRTQRSGRNRLSKRNSYRHQMKDMEKRTWNSYNKLRKAKTFNKRRYKRDAQGSDSNISGRSDQSERRQTSGSMVLTSSCRLYMPHFEIRCLENLYNDPHMWVKHMGHLARSVKTLQFKMKYMKKLRSCLNSYDEKMKANSVRKCECPPAPRNNPPKRKLVKHTLGLRENASHPLVDLESQLDEVFSKEKKIYEEQRETVRLIKVGRQAKLVHIAKLQKKGKFRLKKCGYKGVMCFKLNKKTWSNEPRWEGEEKCYCTNASNNTYWCVRIINENTNVLYCEFITGFKEYFDLNEDPYQLVNREHGLTEEQRDLYRGMMDKLRGCKGSTNCTLAPFTNPYLTTPSPYRHDFDAVDQEAMSRVAEQEDLGMEVPLGRQVFQPDLPRDPMAEITSVDDSHSQTILEDLLDSSMPVPPPKAGRNKARRNKAKWWGRPGPGEKRLNLVRQKDRRRSKLDKKYRFHPDRMDYPKKKRAMLDGWRKGKGVGGGGRGGPGAQRPRPKKIRDIGRRGKFRPSGKRTL